MHKSKVDFEIPIDIKHDLVYCQRALTTHILIHQKIASCVAVSRDPSGRLQKSLRLIEREIIDIGDEQKSLFNRLRFYIDYHQLMKNIKIEERERITCYVRDELQNFSRMARGSEIKPTNVQHRLNEDALHRKYLVVHKALDDETSNSRGHSSRTSVSDEPKTDSWSEKISSVSGSEDEKMEIPVRPDDVQLIEQRVYNGPRQKGSKSSTATATVVSSFAAIQPMSLLKPMHQRIIEENDANGICVVRPEIGLTKKLEEPKLKLKTKQPPPPPQQQQQQQQALPLNLIRMRLSAALCKAKDERHTIQNRIQTESPETVPPPVTQTLTVKCNTTPLSSSPSSNDDGSPASTNGIESPSRDEVDPSEMEQEKFLHLFGLCTPAHTAYLMNRRPQRKKRVCTSTERMEYYYGKFELFEKQFTKRGKRQFLYSPPATRAKRRIASNGINTLAKDVITAAATKRSRGIKSNASSSSSISSNGSSNQTEKVCLTCYKRNSLLQCQKCCGQYHAGCHVSAIDIPTRKIYCPICVRQQKASINNIQTK